MKHLKKHFIFEDLQLYKIEDFFQPLEDKDYKISVYRNGMDENIIDINIVGPEYKSNEFKLDEQERFLKNRVEKLIPILLQYRYNMFEIASGVRRVLDNTHGHISGADYYKKYVTGVDDKLHVLSVDNIDMFYRFRDDSYVDYDNYKYMINFDFKIKPLNYDRMLRNGVKK